MRSATAVSPFLFIFFIIRSCVKLTTVRVPSLSEYCGFRCINIRTHFFPQRRRLSWCGTGCVFFMQRESRRLQSSRDKPLQQTDEHVKWARWSWSKASGKFSDERTTLITLKIKRCQCRSCFGQVCYILLILNVYKSNKTSRWWRVVTACCQNIYADCR